MTTPETLAASLTGGGPRIARAMAAIDRAEFVPERIWPTDFGDPLDRADDPRAWADLVYSDAAITTQVDAHGIPTSSTSKPSLMARMLEAAVLAPGHRVLEAGTATGWNAALLAELVGPGGDVVSVEADPDLAEHARGRLAGHRVRVVTGDGEHPPDGEFGRVMATYAVVRLPPAWIDRSVQGGRIVAPWKPSVGLPGGVLLALDVVDGRAEGRVVGEVSFMLSRSVQRPGRPAALDGIADTVRTVDGDPRETIMAPQSGPVLALTVPDWRVGMRGGADGDHYVWAEDTGGGSWVRAHADGRVESAGPRNLWDELTSARDDWEAEGRPAVTEYGLSVEADGEHRVWLRDADRPGWKV